MATSMTPRVLALATIAAAAIAAALLAQTAIQAQESTPTDTSIVVGTYELQDVAEQYGINQKLMEGMSGLQERMMAAQQQGDQEEMQRIQAEAQQIQDDVVTTFEDEIEAAMPNVAEQTGADIIAVEVGYIGEDIETKDVTQELIAEMDLESQQETEPEQTPQTELPQQQ